MNLPQRTQNSLLPQIAGDKLIEVQLHNRVWQFLLKLDVTLYLQRSCPSACNNYVFIKDKYNLRNDLSVYKKIVNTKDLVSNSDEFLAGHIKDLCLRESPNYPILSSDEIILKVTYECIHTMFI